MADAAPPDPEVARKAAAFSDYRKKLVMHRVCA